MYVKMLSVCLLSLCAMRLAVAQAWGVSGIVVDRGSGLRLSDVNVSNPRTGQMAATNTYGVFIIGASPGDSLAFSKIGYGPVKTVIHTQDDILIEMQAGLTIETVVVNRMGREAEMRGMLDDYRKKGVHNNGKNNLGTYLGSPATALYNLFGRDAKNAKRFAKLMERELEEAKVDRVFNKTTVGELTKLEGDELQSFMDLYRPSAGMVERWGQYDFMSYVKRSFEAWDKNGRPRSMRLPKVDIPPQEK